MRRPNHAPIRLECRLLGWLSPPPVAPARFSVGDRVGVLLEEYRAAGERIATLEEELASREQQIEELEEQLAEARTGNGVLRG